MLVGPADLELSSSHSQPGKDPGPCEAGYSVIYETPGHVRAQTWLRAAVLEPLHQPSSGPGSPKSSASVYTSGMTSYS